MSASLSVRLSDFRIVSRKPRCSSVRDGGGFRASTGVVVSRLLILFCLLFNEPAHHCHAGSHLICVPAQSPVHVPILPSFFPKSENALRHPAAWTGWRKARKGREKEAASTSGCGFFHRQNQLFIWKQGCLRLICMHFKRFRSYRTWLRAYSALLSCDTNTFGGFIRVKMKAAWRNGPVSSYRILWELSTKTSRNEATGAVRHQGGPGKRKTCGSNFNMRYTICKEYVL